MIWNQKYCIYYIKIVIFQRQSNNNMQQNSKEKRPYDNIKNMKVKTSYESIGIQFDQKNKNHEPKHSKLIQQNHFNENEKTNKNIYQESLLQLKSFFQASEAKNNLQFEYKDLNMQINMQQLQPLKAHSQNEQKQAPKDILKTKKLKKQQKTKKKYEMDNNNQVSQRQFKDLQKKRKKQMKLMIKERKLKEKSIKSNLNLQSSNQIKDHEQNQSISIQLLEVFRDMYPYYLLNQKIIFPIQDTLLLKYNELASEAKNEQPIDIQNVQRKLTPYFSKQLQIWNMLIEHPSFFNTHDQMTLQSIPAQVKQLNPRNKPSLFRSFHNFYLHDLLIHKYQQSADQQYFSFISLWKYAEQNNFLQKIFKVFWNKLIYFYITLQQSKYKNQKINLQLNTFESQLNRQLTQGNFQIYDNYEKLLDYLIFLINMCFQTLTFKNLISGKMLFFRDNNKAKNELLEQKKIIDNELWQLKESEKILLKKQKLNVKMIKKQNKNIKDQNQQQFKQKIKIIEEQLQQINQQKYLILQKREKFKRSIVQIENKIYELCCLPQFSNVWLLGEDRYHNLYWFVRERQNSIYRQCKQSGQWTVIQGQNIQQFCKYLNLKGIRQRKLHEKITYYKQLGYIKIKQSFIQGKIGGEEFVTLFQTQKQMNLMSIEQNKEFVYDTAQFQKFSYGEYQSATPHTIKTMILKTQWMMNRYLLERNSKWTSQQLRQQYINYIIKNDFKDIDTLTQQLRSFNEKICVVQINYKVANQNERIDVKTRKIQTKIWGINQKYKHFWYDYSKKCKNISDIHFLISIFYLTVQKYVTKTRKPTNTKYFYKAVQVQQNQQDIENNNNSNDDNFLDV